MAAQAGTNTEREQFEQQQFLNGFRQIKEHEADMAGTKGEMGGVYKRLEKFGFTKADIKWAKELEEEEAPKVIETMKRRIRIAGFFGHGLSRQMEMFDADRTPLEDRAYLEGLAAGKLRKDMTNPYGLETPAGQRFQSGLNDGTAFINRDLSDQFEDEEGEGEDDGPTDPFSPEAEQSWNEAAPAAEAAE